MLIIARDCRRARHGAHGKVWPRLSIARPLFNTAWERATVQWKRVVNKYE